MPMLLGKKLPWLSDGDGAGSPAVRVFVRQLLLFAKKGYSSCCTALCTSAGQAVGDAAALWRAGGLHLSLLRRTVPAGPCAGGRVSRYVGRRRGLPRGVAGGAARPPTRSRRAG